MHQQRTKGVLCIAANTTWYIYNFRRALIGLLLERGYEIVALAPADSYVQRVEALGVRHAHLHLDNASTNPLRELVAVARMAITLNREKPKALLTFTPKVNIYGSIAARMLGIPVIANLSGLGRAFVSGGWLKWVATRLYRSALRQPQTVFFQNEQDRQAFINARLVDPTKARRLPGSGVDLRRFRPAEREDNTETFVFLLVARLLWDKGVGEFVEAAREVKKRFPQADFRLLGFLDVQNPSAISRAQVEQWQKEAVVRYLGVTDEVVPCYAEADCVVLPSYYREGVPRTLLEASSMGIPIITTDTDGCRDTVEDGVTGYLVRARDHVDLADKMAKMLRLAPGERRAMGQRGRAKMCREFDERIVLDTYAEAIDGIERLSAGNKR
jgi:glycosyltransferase involved in cell wall biosynthesis